jgi:hypothetical protein
VPQQTADVIALILTGVVAVVVLLTAVGVIWIEITQPRGEIDQAVDAIGRILAALVAALVGYMAGRKVNGGGS